MLLREVDALGVAAAFEVKSAVVGPAVLVVADQHALGVCGQGGLAGAGKAEEQGGVAVSADVGGAVHREDVDFGQDIIHDREDALLDFARILRTGNQHDFLFIVDQDRRFAVSVVDFGDAFEARCRNDGEIGREVLELIGCRTDQKLVDEQVLRSKFVDDTETLGVFWIGTRETVEDEQLAVLQIGNGFVIDFVKSLLCHRHIDFTPGNLIVNAFAVDDEFVIGRAAGIFSGVDYQCAG